MSGEIICGDCCLLNTCQVEKIVDVFKGLNAIDDFNLEWMMLCRDEQPEDYSRELDLWKSEMMRHFRKNNSFAELESPYEMERIHMHALGKAFKKIIFGCAITEAFNTLEAGQAYVNSLSPEDSTWTK